ncbi:MAG: phosphatidylserine decarboxylase, partial [Ruminococcus sp.]
MKYIDRKGNITIEENGQDKFLRHLYNDWGGRLCLKIIIQPFVTRLGGWFLNTRLSARMISGFVERNHIDLSVCTRQKFDSYNDFFTRRLKEGQRPVAADASVLVSPCDGKVTVSRIGSDSRFY